MHDDERGSILVIVALMMVVLLGFSALVVDVGMVYGQERKLQNALNAAALAGGKALTISILNASTDPAIAAAENNFSLNGYSPSDITCSFSNSNGTIKVESTQTVNYIFAKVLGFSSSSIHLSAAATKTGVPLAFSYALFSGDPSHDLLFHGSSSSVTGDVHSNGGVTYDGSNLTVNGSVEAHDQITVTSGDYHITGSRTEAAHQIAMPDFSVTVEDIAKQGGTYYDGDQNYSSVLDISSSIYVNGNIDFSNKCNLSGEGTIVATKNIDFGGSFVNDLGTNALCLYSVNGNITFTGDLSNGHGILYAPNGTVTINGGNTTFYGRIIAKEIVINGGHFTIISSPSDLSSLPIKESVKLTVPQ